MQTTKIRLAKESDLARINDIYNYYVLNSTCTYQTEPETAAGRAAWFKMHGPQHPIIVAERAGQVVGWGSLSKFHPREAYSRTVEDSVYVQEDLHSQGIGSALMQGMVERAKALGHHTIIAAVDSEQPASLALHKKYGFVEAGRLREAGFKFGKWLDAIYMQRMV
jgi:phosphinothricin acetyltransferase